MSKLFEITGDIAKPQIVVDTHLYRLHLDRREFGIISDIALCASIISALFLDLLSIILVLLPFCDSGLIHGIQLFSKLDNPELVHHTYAQLLFIAILLAILPVALLIRKLIIWQSLQSWNLVGIVLQASTLPYVKTAFALSVVARLTWAFVIKAVIADLSFDRPVKEQPLKSPN